MVLNWWFWHHTDCVIQLNWPANQRQSYWNRILSFSKHLHIIKRNLHNNMVRQMDHVFNNLQALFKLTFIATISSGAERNKYYHLYFVNEELETWEIKCILTVKMHLVSLNWNIYMGIKFSKLKKFHKCFYFNLFDKKK